MIDIATINALSSATTVTPIPTIVPVTVVPALLPEQLMTLVRPLEVTGVIAQVPTTSLPNLVINTALGAITIPMPQALDAPQDKLLQQLVAAFDAQKPVMVFMQAGAPPTQASLLLPHMPPHSPARGQNAPAVLTPSLSEPSAAVPLMKAAPPSDQVYTKTYDAIVLPRGLSWPNAQTTPSAVPAQGEELPANNSTPANAYNNAQTGKDTASSLVPRLTQAIRQMVLGTATPDMSSAKAGNAAMSQSVAEHAPLPISLLVTGSNQTSPNESLPLDPGQTVMVRLAPRTVSTSPTSLPITLPANSYAAVVSGQAPNGAAIVTFDRGTLYLKNPPAVAVGTPLYVTVLDTPPAAANAANPMPLPLPQDDQALVLQSLLNTLQQNDPAVAQQMARNVLFQPMQPLYAPLLLLFASFKHGGVKEWLGTEVVEALTRTRQTALLNKVTTAMATESQDESDAAAGAWQTYSLPILLGQTVHTLACYVHGSYDQNPKQNSDGQAASRPGSLRFVIDLSMSRLGAIQIDGLVQPQKLDIIVRSEAGLPASLHNELQQSYALSMGALGYTGGLLFQEGRQHWLTLRHMDIAPVVT